MKSPFLLGRMRPSAFTLVELLVTISIISLLISILVPSLRKARSQCKQVYCKNSLRGIGVGLTMYTNDSEDHLPYIDTALWQAPPGLKDWDADPSDREQYPYSFINVMREYLGNPKVLVCPSAVLGYPREKYQVTYRIASADNFDGNAHAPVFTPKGGALYAYSLKYLDGRAYEVKHFSMETFPPGLRKGPGPYYLLRDFNKLLSAETTGKKTGKLAHGDVFNQLYLDMHVEAKSDRVTYDND